MAKDGNGKAFQDALKLAIGFGDINYKSYDVKLERVLKGKKKEDVTKKFIQNLKVSGGSGEGIFDTFEKIQENDGIYTLHCNAYRHGREYGNYRSEIHNQSFWLCL